MTDTNYKTQETQPNGSQTQPDWPTIIKNVSGHSFAYPYDLRVVELTKAIMNSPSALNALGLCKVETISLDKAVELKLEAGKIEKLEAELVEAKRSLKAEQDKTATPIDALETAVKVWQNNQPGIFPSKDKPLHIVWVDKSNFKLGICEVPFEGHLASYGCYASELDYRRLRDKLKAVRQVRDRLLAVVKIENACTQSPCGRKNCSICQPIAEAKAQQASEKEQGV